MKNKNTMWSQFLSKLTLKGNYIVQAPKSGIIEQSLLQLLNTLQKCTINTFKQTLKGTLDLRSSFSHLQYHQNKKRYF